MFGTEEPQKETFLTFLKTPKSPENDQLRNVKNSDIMTFKGISYFDIIKDVASERRRAS